MTAGRHDCAGGLGKDRKRMRAALRGFCAALGSTDKLQPQNEARGDVWR